LNGAPLYPFGHGLSYTKFNYDHLKVSSESIKNGDTVTVSVDVSNTGDRAGDEVVQLFVHQIKSGVKRPAEELRGFQRISLKPGETQTVNFTLPAEKLAYWNESTHGFVVEPGAFDILVGASSGDIRLRSQIRVLR